MINLIVILIMLAIEAFIIYVLFTWQREKYELELSKRDKTVSDTMDKIKAKNIKIKELEEKCMTKKK